MGSQAFSTSPSPPLPLRFPPKSQENSRTRRAFSLPSEAHTLSADWSLGLPPPGAGEPGRSAKALLQLLPGAAMACSRGAAVSRASAPRGELQRAAAEAGCVILL